LKVTARSRKSGIRKAGPASFVPNLNTNFHQVNTPGLSQILQRAGAFLIRASRSVAAGFSFPQATN